MWRRITLISIVVLSIAHITGCSRKTPEERSTSYLTIKGSDTMVHLVSTWAEVYMAAYPDVEISVTGGGSGTGIAALINGTTDLAAASRDMKDSEKERVRASGGEPREIVVARDGIAVVVNPANSVTALSLESLKKIFTGQVTNWREVGGEDMDILVLSRESSSGTYAFFQEHVLSKQDYTGSARLMPATSGIIQSVAEDRAAIGYVGLGYAAKASDRVKSLMVSDGPGEPAIAPSLETVNSGAYSIARPLYFYTTSASVGLVKAFIDYALSPNGQRTVREAGYVPIN